VLLDGGEVAAVGGFEELQLVSPDFARMVELGNLK
jgi:hypothetical protein